MKRVICICRMENGSPTVPRPGPDSDAPADMYSGEGMGWGVIHFDSASATYAVQVKTTDSGAQYMQDRNDAEGAACPWQILTIKEVEVQGA
jgi:hypothetical protein